MNNKALGGTQFFASAALDMLYKDLEGRIFCPKSLSKGLEVTISER